MPAKRIFLSPPHMSGQDRVFVQAAFDSNYIAPLGPMVDAFEREFAERVGIRHAVAVSSGTAAMHLALRVLGVGPGDEVIVSSLTFIGSVSPVIFQGATPVFVDSDRASWNMDPILLEKELEACEKRGKLPKVVAPTDLYGQCADLDRILEICEPYGIPVVVDAAEAMGAKYELATDIRRHTQTNRDFSSADPSEIRSTFHGAGFAEEKMSSHTRQNVFKKYKHAGAGAKAAVFSFNGNKIITTSGGGMLASDDESLIAEARFLSQQAKDPVPHYEHSHIGYNYRMSNIIAAIGRGQLMVLDDRVEAKRKVFSDYEKALADIPGIEFMPEAPYGRSNRWLTVILITPEQFGADREAVRLALDAENIEARPVWKPMHLQPVFQITHGAERMAQSGRRKANTYKARPSEIRSAVVNEFHRARVVGGKVAEDLFNRGLCLPSGTAMTEEDLDRVISVILDCRKVN